MNKKMFNLLYRSFEVPLNHDEQAQLSRALDKSKQLKKEMEKITFIREKVAANKEQGFKPFFVVKVMQKINEISITNNYELLFHSLVRIFKPVMVAAILLIIVISTYNISNSKQISLEGILAVPQVTLEQAFDPALTLNMGE